MFFKFHSLLDLQGLLILSLLSHPDAPKNLHGLILYGGRSFSVVPRCGKHRLIDGLGDFCRCRANSIQIHNLWRLMEALDRLRQTLMVANYLEIWISIQLDQGSFSGAQVELLLKWPKWWNLPTCSNFLTKMRSIPYATRRWLSQSSLNWRRWD